MFQTHGFFASTAIGLILAAGGPAAAEAVLDGSTGSTGSFSGQFEIPQTAGRLEGSNLFHSFERFHVRTGESATFTGGGGIDNVISRVTGDEASTIDGRLASTIPGADFFFLNPNGVMFGPEAILDVPGSFHVSTADELRFADGTALSARDPSTSSFTAAAPEAFGFLGADAGTIRVEQGQLRVLPNQTLSLVGGPIEILGDGADEPDEPIDVDPPELDAPGGRIRIASGASDGTVNVQTGENTTLESFNVLLSDEALVLASGDSAGEIRVSAFNLVLDGGAEIFANNTGTVASSGGIVIQAGSMIVDQGGIVATNATSSGDAGRLSINLLDALQISGRASVESAALEGAAGRAGRIDIRADSVAVSTGGQISNSTFGSGDANAINIEAARLEIDGSGVLTGIFSEAERGSTGAAGNIIISADTVMLENAAAITSSSLDRGDAGSVDISGDVIELRGGSVIISDTGSVFNFDDEQVPVSVFGDAGTVTVAANVIELHGGSEIASDAARDSGGDAGTVSVSANELTLSNSEISSEAFASGDSGTLLVEVEGPLIVEDGSLNVSGGLEGQSAAGEIIVEAGQIELRNGSITSETFAGGDGGAITVRTENMTMDGARITSSTEGAGDGGSIIVRVDEEVVLDKDAFISSDTLASGNGGNVIVEAQRIEILSEGIFSDSFSQDEEGDGGNVLVTAEELFVGAEGAITSRTEGERQAGVVVLVADTSEILGEVGTSSTGSGDAGTVALAGENFAIRDGGQVTSESSGGGAAAGDIQLQTETLTLSGAKITTIGRTDEGGRIFTVGDGVRLIHLVDGRITSDGAKSGTDVSIIALRADQIVLNSSEVTSLTGGQVITGSGEARLLGDLTVISTDSTVEASSRLEIGGLESDVTAGIEVLPGAFLDVSGQLRASCAARRSEEVSSFVQTGEIGLAPEPNDFLPGTYAGLSGSEPGDVSVSGAVFLPLPAACNS